MSNYGILGMPVDGPIEKRLDQAAQNFDTAIDNLPLGLGHLVPSAVHNPRSFKLLAETGAVTLPEWGPDHIAMSITPDAMLREMTIRTQRVYPPGGPLLTSGSEIDKAIMPPELGPDHIPIYMSPPDNSKKTRLLHALRHPVMAAPVSGLFSKELTEFGFGQGKQRPVQKNTYLDSGPP